MRCARSSPFIPPPEPTPPLDRTNEERHLATRREGKDPRPQVPPVARHRRQGRLPLPRRALLQDLAQDQAREAFRRVDRSHGDERGEEDWRVNLCFKADERCRARLWREPEVLLGHELRLEHEFHLYARRASGGR